MGNEKLLRREKIMKIEILLDKSEAEHYLEKYFTGLLGLDDVDILDIMVKEDRKK